MKLIIVEWVDSNGDSRWHNKHDAACSKISHCWSVGALLSQDEEQIVIAPSGDPAIGNVLYELAIPRVAVKRIRELRVREGMSK
jgi:hypothetical protein